MQTIQEKLATQDTVLALYKKADGSVKSYMLTKRKAPSYDAKTDRVKVEVPPHLVNAYDMASQKFVSLKIEGIFHYE